MIKNKILPLLFFFIFISPFSISAQAGRQIGLSVIPPRVEILIEPGKSVTREIKIRNDSSSKKTVDSVIKNFIVKDDKGTPIQLDASIDQDQARWAASQWVSITPSSIVLLPGEIKSFIITVTAPTNATPGGHYAMILHSPKYEASSLAPGSIIQTIVGTLLYISVPGDVKQDAFIEKFVTEPRISEYGPVTFNLTIQNLSDIHIAPKGKITIDNFIGKKINEININATNIFPYTKRVLNPVLANKWLFGRYKASLLANYGSKGGLLTANLYFWVIPWKILLITITILVIIISIIILLKHKPHLPRENNEFEKIDQLKNQYQDNKPVS